MKKTVKKERTNSREGDLKYSKWHRKLPYNCYMMNLDCIEWRADRGIVAFIETAFYENKTLLELLEDKKWEIKVLDELQQKTRIPAYLVFHTDTLSLFWVYVIAEGQPYLFKTLPRYDYEQFIKKL